MTPIASERHRRHIEAIAAGEALAEEERYLQAAVTPSGERMLASFRLAASMPWTAAFLAEDDARADGQMEIARRRIALGLDRPS